MKNHSFITALALGVLVFTGGCAVDDGAMRETASAPMRGASSAAESACMTAVNSNYGGSVKNLNVTSSEFSQANSMVMLDADGETWRCLVSEDGEVQDLSVRNNR